MSNSNTSVRVISQSPDHNQEMIVTINPGGSRTTFRPINPNRPTRPFNKFPSSHSFFAKKSKSSWRH